MKREFEERRKMRLKKLLAMTLAVIVGYDPVYGNGMLKFISY